MHFNNHSCYLGLLTCLSAVIVCGEYRCLLDVAANNTLRLNEDFRKTTAIQPCKESFSPGGLWSPRTQQPSARLSPPPARRDQPRGPAPDQPYHSTSLVARSRTPSPSRTNPRSPAPQYYGTANLTDRSRSPSPDAGGVASPVAPVRRPPPPPEPHSGSEHRRRRRRRRRGDAASTGQMPRVLPSPTVTPHHSPDRFNFPRLFTSPSTSPPWSPLTRHESFQLQGDDRQQTPTTQRRSNADPRRRYTEHFDSDLDTVTDARTTGAARRLYRQPSESMASVPCGPRPGGVRTSNTWTGQHHYRRHDSLKHDANDNVDVDSDSESDGEGWC